MKIAADKQKSSLTHWKLHGDGKSITADEAVQPDERLTWSRTSGIGMQHIVATFGATLLVPLLTGFSPATTLFFTGLGTLLFIGITVGRLPSYLGPSFVLIAPIGAVIGHVQGGGAPINSAKMALAQGGVISAGALLLAVGLTVHFAGAVWIDRIMPPIVTGAIVSLIGFNLAPSVQNNVKQAPVTATVIITSVLPITMFFKGIIGRLSTLIGVLTGYVYVIVRGEVEFEAISKADWVGFPQLHTPASDPSFLGLFLPVVLVLVTENIGHVRSAAAITGQNLSDFSGRTLMADGLSTMIAGSGGGSGTTTYTENIGVMAATRVHSTVAYIVAVLGAIMLSMPPKLGGTIATIPPGVLGGAAMILYSMIGMLGVCIWVQNQVDFSDPVNLNTAAAAMAMVIANYTLKTGSVSFEGIALESLGAIVIYHLMRWISSIRGISLEQASPASAPAGTELDSIAYRKRYVNVKMKGKIKQLRVTERNPDAGGDKAKKGDGTS